MDNVRIRIFIDSYTGGGMRAINNAYTVYNAAFGYSFPNFGGNVIEIGSLCPKRILKNHNFFSLFGIIRFVIPLYHDGSRVQYKKPK